MTNIVQNLTVNGRGVLRIQTLDLRMAGVDKPTDLSCVFNDQANSNQNLDHQPIVGQQSLTLIQNILRSNLKSKCTYLRSRD